MNLSLLIKPASSLCNLRCKYCFYADVSNSREVKSFGIMNEETINIIASRIYEYLLPNSNLHIGFQGGEPTLAGLEFFEKFTKIFVEKLNVKKIKITYSIQTNGINLNKEFCEFLAKNKFLVGLSLDILDTHHDKNRLDGKGEATYKKVLNARDMLKEAGVEYNILSVLTKEMAQEPKKVWKAIMRSGERHIQFIPCLSGLTDEKADEFALSGELFAGFYTGLLPLWYKAHSKKDYVSIRFFDDLFNLLLYRVVNSCGFTGKCTAQLIVEADGGVYPCDFYALDEYKIGNLRDKSIQEIKEHKLVGAFIKDSGVKSKLCSKCVYQRMCKGGCKRMAKEMYADKEFCGYQSFLDNNQDFIEEILKELRDKA